MSTAPPANPSSSRVNRRQKADVLKLMNAKYQLEFPEENRISDFFVKFAGPTDTPYVDGLWTLHVTLPNEYPYKSPSIGFMNRIYHPNVDEVSGSICLDVINQTWTPMFDLLNIFETFIPQLLRYPNPADPLNGQAAQLLLKDEIRYNARVREYVKLYAHNDACSSTPAVVVPSSRQNEPINTSDVCSSLDEGVTSFCDSSFVGSQLASTPSFSEGGILMIDAVKDIPCVHSMEGGVFEVGTEGEEDMLWDTLSDVSEMSDL